MPIKGLHSTTLTAQPLHTTSHVLVHTTYPILLQVPPAHHHTDHEDLTLTVTDSDCPEGTFVGADGSSAGDWMLPGSAIAGNVSLILSLVSAMLLYGCYDQRSRFDLAHLDVVPS